MPAKKYATPEEAHEARLRQNREAVVRYRETHREELNALRRAYYHAHRDEARAKQREYYHEHRYELNARRAEYFREYYRAHRDELNARARERRAAAKAAEAVEKND